MNFTVDLKPIIFHSCQYLITGAILMSLCKILQSYLVLVIGRFIVGIACGCFTGLVPLYISEISPLEFRGRIGSLNQLSLAIGLLTSQIVGIETLLGNKHDWPILIGVGGCAPALAQLLLVLFIPESPKYLVVVKGDLVEGWKACKKLGQTEEDFQALKDQHLQGVSVLLFKSKAIVTICRIWFF